MVARSWDPACQYVKLAADGQRPTQKYKALLATRGSFLGTRQAQSSPRRPRGHACNLVGSGGPCRREVRDQRIDLLGPVSCYGLCAAGDSARSRMKHTYTPVRDAKPGQSGNPARTQHDPTSICVWLKAQTPSHFPRGTWGGHWMQTGSPWSGRQLQNIPSTPYLFNLNQSVRTPKG